MADLLTSIRAEIDARMGELEPLLAEYEELLAAADALAPGGYAASAPAAATSAPAPAASAPVPAAPGPAAARTATEAAARFAKARKAPAKTRRPAGGRTRGGRPSIAPTGQAIIAALEHGSHTVAELVVVTALSAQDIRRDLRPLLKRGSIAKTDRDGKPAYVLSAAGE